MTSSPDRYALLKAFARENRSKATLGETILWECLRAFPKPYKFRRQHIIGDFIADFACMERNLVIEVDGGYHAELQQQIDDQIRTEWLTKMGFQVLRLSNEQVINSLHEVRETIDRALQEEDFSS